MQFEKVLNNLVLRFEVDDQKRVYLEHFGTKEYNFLSCPKDWRHFVEIETSSSDHFGSHNSKHFQTPYSLDCRYIGHEIKDNEIIITTADKMLQAETHFIFYPNVDGFSVYNIVKNISDKPVFLEYVSSFYILGFGSLEKPCCKDMYFHKASNSWHCEAQWRRESFLDAGLFNGNDYFTMKAIGLQNTGSWSTKDYLPMAIIENAKENFFLLSQIENNGSWDIEIGDFLNKYYLSVSGPDYIHNKWCKKILPNETFNSCQASVTIGDSFEKVIQEITKVRRAYRRINKDDIELPVIFNDYMHALWDTQTEKDIWPLVDIASEVGCEEFCIDAGWFAKTCGWTNSIGEWKEYSDNFPHGGLKGTIDYIHSKGMKGGIWYEIENMGLDCRLIKDHILPDDWFFQINGEPAKRNYRYALNFDNPEVYKWAMDLVYNDVKRYGLDYIKNDYNVDSGVGNEYNSDSAGDGLLKHNRAFIRWLNELSDKCPNLTIENCGSGGCRMDYEMLKVCPIQSTSDQTDYRKYPYLSSAVLTAATPEQAAVWSYPVNKQINEPVTDEVVAMNMVNAMLGRIHLASFINELTPAQLQLVKDGVQYFKDIREMKRNSLPIYPNGISYFFDPEVVGGIINDKKIILCVWNTSGNAREIKVTLKKYDIKSLKVSYPLSLPTNFEFDGSVLKVKFDIPYGGRVFEIDLK